MQTMQAPRKPTFSLSLRLQSPLAKLGVGSMSVFQIIRHRTRAPMWRLVWCRVAVREIRLTPEMGSIISSSISLDLNVFFVVVCANFRTATWFTYFEDGFGETRLSVCTRVYERLTRLYVLRFSTIHPLSTPTPSNSQAKSIPATRSHVDLYPLRCDYDDAHRRLQENADWVPGGDKLYQNVSGLSLPLGRCAICVSSIPAIRHTLHPSPQHLTRHQSSTCALSLSLPLYRTLAPVQSEVKFNRGAFFRIHYDVRRARLPSSGGSARLHAVHSWRKKTETHISTRDRAKMAHAKLDVGVVALVRI